MTTPPTPPSNPLPDTIAGLRFDDLLGRIAAKTPTPGGGAVASAVGALAAALAQMVVSFSVGKKSLAAHEPALRDAAAVLDRARAVLLRLADEDAAAYAVVNELWKLPESDARRAREMPAAAHTAVSVPLSVMATCAEVLRRLDALGAISNRHLRSDLAIAAVLADAAARASRWNVTINAGLLTPEARAASAEASGNLLRFCDRLRERVERDAESPA